MIPADTIPRAVPLARSGSSLAWGAALVRLAVPGGVWASGLSLATFAQSGGVETAFLAGWVAAVLLVMAAVAPAPARELGWTAVLATLILWVLPPDPTRGAALGLLVVAALAVATARAWTRWRRAAGGRRLLTTVALAVGWHLVYASGALATGELSPGSLVAGPVLAGLSLAFLARLHGEHRVWIAGAAVLVACQGFDPVAGVCLAMLAGAEELRRWVSDGPAPLGAPWIPALAATGGVLTVLVALPFVRSLGWSPSFGPAASAVQASLLVPLLLPAAFVAVLWRPRPEQPRWPALVTLGLALVMAGTVMGALRQGSLTAALPWAASPGWLAWPVALTALVLPRRHEGVPAGDAPLLSLQWRWSGLLAIAAAVPAAYPWLRGVTGDADESRSIEVALAPLGLDLGPWPVLGVLVAMAGLAFLARWDRRLPGATAIAVVASLVVFHLPPAPLAVATQGGRVLTVDSPSWQLELPGEAAGSVILDTLLTHSAGLAPGTPVATVILEEGTLGGAAGRSTEWQLAAGLDTGEWAAARPDVAAHPGSVAPRPWVSWLERDTTTSDPRASGRFLAQRYRTRLALDSPHPGDRLKPSRLSVIRRDDLPPDVQVTLFHGEVRP